MVKSQQQYCNMIEKLRELMVLNVNMKTLDIEERFEQISHILFDWIAIKKGQSLYRFKEIEFYFYNQHHRDIITHPRTSKALCWYVNDFGGIDLNFASTIEQKSTKEKGKSSQYLLTKESVFGGILIRQLTKEDTGEILNGPWACAELFRCFDAMRQSNDLPFLVEYNNKRSSILRQPRINLLSSKQTIEGKIDSILSKYHSTLENQEFNKDFSMFIEKRYRYVRCDSMIHDCQTNEVYFSPWLKDKKDGHPDFYQKLINLLRGIGIETKELKHTRDYWARDYMPIQLGKNEFLKYRYYPDYLVKSKNPEDIETITDCTKVLQGMGIYCRSTKLIIDGGNMVICGPYIVMTDKVFAENGYEKNDQVFINKLESELGHPIIIIPWTMHGDFHEEETDKYGHSDGFLKWCGENRILMGNHGDEYPQEACAIRTILESFGFEVTEMRFKDKVKTPCTDLNWAYINFLQVGNQIILPKFNIEEDEIAARYVQNAFEECEIHQIEMTDIAKEGGALHCISWNIQK